jgi:TonB-dependent SusC/RagA subfamily outer membrane receptor
MTRRYFQGGLIFSYIAPLIRFDFRILPPLRNNMPQLPPSIQPTAGLDIQYIPEIYRHVEPASAPLPLPEVQWWQQYSSTDVLTAILLVGTVVMLIRFALQYASLGRLHVYQQHQYKTYRILSIAELIKPFSFGRRIYVNPKLHSADELNEIILHETIHIRHHHSIDIIVSSINRSIFWWNPFVWILSNDIRNNLEYIVDSEMLQTGVDRKHYQYHLLNISQRTCIKEIANYFNFSNLKKRINMMNRKKTQPVYKIKWLLMPIVAAAILLSFNIKRAVATNANFAVTSEIIEPEPVADSDTLVNKSPAAGVNKADAETNAVMMQSVMTVRQHPVAEEFAKQIIDVITEKDATFNIHYQTFSDTILRYWVEVTGTFSDTAEFVNRIIATIKTKSNIVAITENSDGKIIIRNEAINNDSDTIRKYRRIYDVKGTIVSDNSTRRVTSESTEFFPHDDETNPELIIHCNCCDSTRQSPLILIDGKEMTTEDLNSLKSEDIHSFSILKHDSLKIYGNKGKEGILSIITRQKDENIFAMDLNRIPDSVNIADHSMHLAKVFTKNEAGDCMIVIDNKESTGDDLSKLTTDKIRSLHILSRDVAGKIYGDRGKVGAIYVITRENPEPATVMSVQMLSHTLNHNNNELFLETDTALYQLIDTKENPLYALRLTDSMSITGINGGQLIIIDDRESNETEFRTLKKNAIHSLTVLKDEAAVRIYGDKGKNGVIIVTTEKNKNAAISKRLNEAPFVNVSPNILIFIDGRDATKEKLSKLTSDEIDSVSMLREDKAVKLYGDRGKNGVIIVITKKALRNR